MKVDDTICVEPFSSYPVNAVVVLIEFVIAQFVENEEQDEDTAGHTDGQAGHVNKAVTSMFDYIPESYFKIVLKHIDKYLYIFGWASLLTDGQMARFVHSLPDFFCDFICARGDKNDQTLFMA
jgi:hypothetical protein